MKNIISLFIALTLISPLFLFLNREVTPSKSDLKSLPSDWFNYQRAFPAESIPYQEYFNEAERELQFRMVMKNSNLTTTDWVPVGPYNIGGRITALTVDPVDNNIIYIGAAAGGIFKSTDNGVSWQPKTDFMQSLSIGDMTHDPNNRNIIYCGTGEANTSGDSYPGIGLLKSTDYGETWMNIGLSETRHIAKVIVHPLNSNLIYVAASGGLYSKDTNRGVYKSTDAGSSWTKIFYMNDSTGAIDLAVDPTDPNRIYAAMWERLRGASFRRVAGLSSGLFMSTDGGTNWNRLSSGLPAANLKTGRISVAVAPSNPNYVYTLFKSSNSNNGSDNNFSAFYRSTNKGASWSQMAANSLSGEFSNFGWYFGLIAVDPLNHNKVYVGDIDLFVSADGGNQWTNLTNSYSVSFAQQHPDQHPIWIHPTSTNKIYLGNDGGLFTSTNGGTSWIKSYDLPISQFYAATVDYLNPQKVFGGTQDNGTLGTLDGSLNNWDEMWGGDGFHCIVDYTNSNIIYAESQWGGIVKSTNGGNSFSNISLGLDLSRTNWSSPYIIDPKDPEVLYFGSFKLHQTKNGGGVWAAVSQDLTRGPNGRQGTITAIAAAVAQDTSKRIFYVGTDDAKLSVSTDRGATWFDRTGSLPNRYITDVVADNRNPAIAYVALSGFNLDLTNPHIFKTTDYGVTWMDVSSNLPDVPLNSIIIDYDHDSVLYVGGDLGVYYTTNLGTGWQQLGSNLPNSPVFDLMYHQPTKKLFAATHGRSIYKKDISNILSDVKDEISSIKDFEPHQNFPNPFNPSTTISFTLNKNSFVTLRALDILGSEVKVVLSKEMNAGIHKVNFNSEGLASGTYFYELQVGNSKVRRKMLIVK